MTSKPPKMPAIPKPEPLPEPPTIEQTTLQSQEDTRKKRKKAKGFESTILTGSGSDSTTLLGG